MIEHIKQFWKHYVASAVMISSAYAAGIENGQQAPAPLDCKGQECQVQVIVSEPNFRDAIYYKPDDWNQKTAPEIEAETQARYDNWKAVVEQQSNATSTDEQTPQN